MSFKSLWFVCFATSLVVSVGAVPYGQHPPVGEHAASDFARMLPKRQEQLWRNETRSTIPPATTWKISSVSPEPVATAGRSHTPPVSRSDSASLITTTQTPSPSHNPEKLSLNSFGPSGTARNEAPSFSKAPVSSRLPSYDRQSSSQLPGSSIASRQYTSSSLPVLTPSSIRTLEQDISDGTSSTAFSPESPASEQILKPVLTTIPAPTSVQIVLPQTTVQVPIALHMNSEVEVWANVPTPSMPPLESKNKLAASIPSSGLLPLTPLPQATSSQVVTVGFGKSASQVSLSPSDGTPLASSAPTTSLWVGASQGVPVLTATTVTYSTPTSSSIVELPLVSVSVPVVSSTLADIQWSLTPATPESSTYVATTATWPPSLASVGPSTSIVQQPIVTSLWAPILSAVPNVPTTTHSSNIAIIPASKSASHLSYATTLSSVSTLIGATTSGIFFPDTSGAAAFGRPSDIAPSRSHKTSASHSWTSPTIPSVLVAVNSSIYIISSGTVDLQAVSKTGFRVSSFDRTAVHSAFPSTAPTKSSLVNKISASAPHLASETTWGHRGWNISSFLNAAASPTTVRGATVPTGLVTHSNTTQLGATQPSPIPVRSNSKDPYPTINNTLAIGATTLSLTTSPTSKLDTSATSTVAVFSPDAGATRIIPANLSPTKSASATAAAAPLPPLTTSQTAGVAIAGTAGLLIAIVAAIYMARRYHAKKARRTSIGSIYPKVAYLYDPPAGGNDDDGEPADAYMSGGFGGMPLNGNSFRAPPNSPNYGQRYSTGMLPVRYSDPGNPFRDPEDPFRHSKDSTESSTHAPANAAAALSTAIRGYKATSQKSPSLADFLAEQRSRDIIVSSPMLSPSMSDERSANKSSILSEIASMAYNSRPHPNAATLRYQPLSPYGYHQNHCLPCVRETVYTDPFRDPFEHDLLLQVDARTETPDSVTVFAPSTTAIKPAKILSKNPWASSMLSPVSAQERTRSQSSLVKESPISPDATIVTSERFSLVYGNQSSTTYIAPSQRQENNTVSPISPPLGPSHRGWDDIKRYSADKVVPPSVISLSPPLRHFNPPPIKKKSLPQLRRKEFAPSNSPLMVKIPLPYHKNSNVDGPKLSQFTKLDAAKARNEDIMKSPDSTFSHSVHSLASLVHKKKNEDLEFACAGV